MEPVSSLFGDTSRYTTPTKEQLVERGDLMKYFLEQLNPRRVAAGYPPLDYPRLGKMLKGRPNQFLYMLRRLCDDSSNWSATFYCTLYPEKYKKKS